MKYDNICCSGYQLARMLGRTQKIVINDSLQEPWQEHCREGPDSISDRRGSPLPDGRPHAVRTRRIVPGTGRSQAARFRSLSAKGLSSSAIWRSNQYSA